MQVLIGLLVGIPVFLFLLPLIPGLVGLLANKPNRYRPHKTLRGGGAHAAVGTTEAGPPGTTELTYPKSEFGFFTYIQPGRVKRKERGQRFITLIMRFDGYMFEGERTDNDLIPRQHEYWKVVRTKNGFDDSGPVPFPDWRRDSWWLYAPISILWWMWKWWVYKITGAVFVAWPFERIPAYRMKRFKQITKEDGSSDYVPIEDWSDHYRVADFQYPAKIARADTKDKIPVTVLVNEVARVVNPYMTAYYTDEDWPLRLYASIADAITTYTRSRPLDDVQSAKNANQARELANEISLIGDENSFDKKRPEERGPVCDFGLVIRRSQIIDISPVTLQDGDIAKQLADLAVAKVEKEADKERAEGKAAYIEKSGEALRQYPEAAIIPSIEGMVRAAEALNKGGGIGIFGGGIEPGQAALLRQLRQLQQPGGTP